MNRSKRVYQQDQTTVNERGYTPRDAYIFQGTLHQDQTTDHHQGLAYLPTLKTYLGTSNTQANEYRDLFFLNNNGAVEFNETLDDRRQILTKFADYVIANPVLSYYPYLYPLSIFQDWSARTQTFLDLSKSRPDTNRIYKHLGKGLGDIVFYKSGNAIANDPELYDYNGYLYSGTLVQLHTQLSETSGVYETVVIPYQSGRGIPDYSRNYYPETSTTTNAETPPWGPLQYDPEIAPGVFPGKNTVCVGIVLDSFTQPGVPERSFIYSEPSGFTSEQLDTDTHVKYLNRPAPHTAPAVSFVTDLTQPKTQGFLSPGPNLSGVYFSPWPRYYAYQPGDPVPILTKGITTARIGAAYNIAVMTYGVRTQISSTDEVWVPVQSIPLFQGERLEAGSYIYAAVKGHTMTAGPFQDIDPDTLAGDNTQYVAEGVLGQTPWDHFVDSTYGNYGVTGTPALSFSNIPDTSVSILQTLPDISGNTATISHLHQAAQGSIIVQPVTSIGPSPAIGNAYLQTQIELSTQSLTEAEAAAIREERTDLPGISGRCMLPQTNPELAHPIGILLETIQGTGKWTFTGLPLDSITFPTTVDPVVSGAVYGSGVTLGNTPLRGGSDTGKEATFTTLNQYYPILGGVTTPITETVVGGAGYLVGDILTFQDDSLTYNLTPQYKDNNAAVEITALGPPATLELHAEGSGYTTASLVSTFNLSLNNGYFFFETAASQISPVAGGVANPNLYFQKLDVYIPEYTIIRVLDATPLVSEQGYFRFDDYPDATDQNMVTLTNGTNYPNIADSYYETLIIDYNRFPPSVDIVAAGGQITSITISDYGAGNVQSDRLLILDGEFNAVFEYPEIPLGYQELIAAVPTYDESLGPYDSYVASTGATTNTLFDVYSQPANDPTEIVPVAMFINTLGTAVAGTDYNLRYLSGYTHVDPWYHGNRSGVEYTAATDVIPIRGGTGYTTATGVSCYNLTANPLRLLYAIQNETLQSYVTQVPPYSDANFLFDTSRYTFDATNGTQVRVLYDGTETDRQEILRLEDFDVLTGLTASEVRSGGLYAGLADGQYIFQTQRLDQTNPTVDITVTSGRIRTVRLNTLGTGNQNGDLILITQSGTDSDNAVFIFNDNMPTVDYPPYATRSLPNYKIDTSEAAWERYADVMSSAVNLLDRQVLVELHTGQESEFMENITPYAFVGGQNAPPTEDLYKNQYPAT
jgi:hypothetical protein